MQTLHNFFNKKEAENLESNDVTESPPNKTQKLDKDVSNFKFKRDPGLRRQICTYPLNQRDEIRRMYMNAGPFQCKLSDYPKSGAKVGQSNHPRRFVSSWFNLFPSWLEYSPSKDAVFCLPFFLFHKPGANYGQNAFTVDGFRNWRKVRNGKDCAFLNHVGDINSCHRNAERACHDLMNQSQHIRHNFVKSTSQQVAKNRLRLKASIDVTRWLAFQGLAFRGHDERPESINRGNFLELLELLALYNEDVAAVVLENAPQNAMYTSGKIQKQILYLMSQKVKRAICEEINDAKFCIIVDEARDESKKEQMAIVLRFVDKNGLVQERFFGVVHVLDTKACTLKEGIFSILSHNNLDIQRIRGQGYDGASNMRGEFNGLQALVTKDCPYAYYIHCFAHRLQLALVGASKEVVEVQKFFDKLAFIVNVVCASCKQIDELKEAQAAKIANLIAIGELETGKGLNQVSNLQKAGDTRWSSHLRSISSLINMFSATFVVLNIITDEGSTAEQRGGADSALNTLTSFEFVLMLHILREIMDISDTLCQALQRKSQDILNAIQLVSNTKTMIQNLRDGGWNPCLTKVKSFCQEHNIDIPEMNAPYVARRGRARKSMDEVSIEHHYRVNIYIATIDVQLNELNRRFNENSMELLKLSFALDPRDVNHFKVDDICKLVDKYYPKDFDEYEKMQLRMQLRHYELEASTNSDFQTLTSLSSLSEWLVNTRKSAIYPLVNRLVRLILTLPVSTATTERAFFSHENCQDFTSKQDGR